MIVGLTGGIGSGKTTVAKLFKKRGIPVYDSDKQAKKLMRRSKKVKNKITALLGDQAYSGSELNSTFIANKVFSDQKLLLELNGIVHPAVRKHFKKWVEKQDAPYVIQEVAIIFENGIQESYDKIILVTAPMDIRIDRIQKRDNVSEKKIRERMDNQWPDTKKIPLSDFVIENIDLQKTRLKINEIHDRLLDYS